MCLTDLCNLILTQTPKAVYGPLILTQTPKAVYGPLILTQTPKAICGPPVSIKSFNSLFVYTVVLCSAGCLVPCAISPPYTVPEFVS
jgi:hypothetical protein